MSWPPRRRLESGLAFERDYLGQARHSRMQVTRPTPIIPATASSAPLVRLSIRGMIFIAFCLLIMSPFLV
ncbi:MAG: hypothetical protein CFK52_13135 [Chloracidobacterium sp. CP2_5A]|nr:MAG: hypothetical protein CFK52_13135 [Chloracidobacterium sp. CP2_5A]